MFTFGSEGDIENPESFVTRFQPVHPPRCDPVAITTTRSASSMAIPLVTERKHAWEARVATAFEREPT